MLRVRHFGVELERVDLALHVRHRGERGVRGRRDRREARRQLVDAVAVAHPDVQARTGLRVIRRTDVRELEIEVHVGGGIELVHGQDAGAVAGTDSPAAADHPPAVALQSVWKLAGRPISGCGSSPLPRPTAR